MVQFVIAHGRGQEFEVPAELQEAFERALRWGLERVDAPYFDDVPVDFAFYGEAFRPDKRSAAEIEAEPLSELQRRLAEDLLRAAGVDLDMPANKSAVDRLGLDSFAKLAALLDEHLGIGGPIIRAFLRDVDDYLRREELRDEVIGHVVDTIAQIDDDVILLGHSMGGIVVYDVARRRPELRVRGLLTFGAPLGLKTIRDLLKQKGTPRRFPEAVQRWANVFDPRDTVTGGKSIKPYYPARDGRAVEDVRSRGQPALLPGAAHDWKVYLSSTALASALVEIVETLDPSLAGAATANGGGRGRGRGRGGARRPRARQQNDEPAKPPSVWVDFATPPRLYRPHDSGASSGDFMPLDERPSGTRGSREGPSGMGGDVRGGGGQRREAAVGRAAGGSVPPRRASADASDRTPAATKRPRRAEPEAAAKAVKRSASADFPPWVDPGSETRLRFHIGKRAKHDKKIDLLTTTDPGADRLDLVVTVDAVDFKVVDEEGQPSANRASVSLDLRDAKASVEGSFLLRAPRIRKPRQTAIFVRFFHGSELVGRIVLPTEIGGARRPVPPPAAARAEHQGQVSIIPLGAPAAEVVLHVDELPDGRFAISGSRSGSNADFDSRSFGTFPENARSESAWAYAHSLLDNYRDLDALPRDQREDRVNALGSEFWSHLPKEFHNFYWTEMHNKNLSLVVQSDEPYIPWELLVPRRPSSRRPALMFGRAFSMARWDAGETHRRPFPVSDFAVVAPTYALDRLDAAALEAEDLERRFQARRVTPGRREQMLRLLRSRKLSVLHFSGHGSFDPDQPDNSVIRLMDEPIIKVDLQNATLGKSKEFVGPLIFLNACEVGAQGFALTGIGGWAVAFRVAGSAVFVGPYWAVNDDVARKVSMRFYGGLRFGLTIGQAMQEVRSGFTDEGVSLPSDVARLQRPWPAEPDRVVRIVVNRSATRRYSPRHSLPP